MKLTERLKDIQKRLSYVAEMKNARPEDYQAVLVAIIRDCQRDGAEFERQACAKIANEETAIPGEHPASEDFGTGYRECASYVEYRIRARGGKKGKE